MLLTYEGKSSKKSFLVKFECDVLLASFENWGDLILVEFLNDSYVADRSIIDCKRMFGLAEREEINIEDVFWSKTLNVIDNYFHLVGCDFVEISVYLFDLFIFNFRKSVVSALRPFFQFFYVFLAGSYLCFDSW